MKQKPCFYFYHGSPECNEKGSKADYAWKVCSPCFPLSHITKGLILQAACPRAGKWQLHSFSCILKFFLYFAFGFLSTVHLENPPLNNFVSLYNALVIFKED